MNKHKGFTLVELLIVIVVIGILASMMMISTSESTSTAKANTIISNLRNFSMAAMAYYTDNMDDYGRNVAYNTNATTKSIKSHVVEYMHNEGDIPDKEKYKVLNDYNTDTKASIWWARYDASNADARIKEKLAGRAKSANLKEKSDTALDFPSRKVSEQTDYKDQRYVWLMIRTNKRN